MGIPLIDRLQSWLLVLCLATVCGIGYSQQPSICGSNPLMTSFCNQACIICDIDGFTGRNNSNIVGQAPPGFCTSQVHHMQWIGFIAGTVNLSIEVRVSNCQRNEGLEIGLYESFDCQSFRRISECDTDIRPGETKIFNNIVPLVIGQYYYFVMDGSSNDICDWSIRVLQGSTKVSPLDNPAPITMPDTVCSNEVFSMSTTGLLGATQYTWSIDGISIKYGGQVSYQIEKAGDYNICLDAANVCDQAPQSCKKISVLPSSTFTYGQEICYGECFAFHGQSYCQTGKYDVQLQAANGCDSIVTLDLLVADKVTTQGNLYICDGDTIRIGNQSIYQKGVYEVVIENEEGCTIYMDLEVKVVECDITTEAQVEDVGCNGENTGAITFRIEVGTPPFSYEGFKLENKSITFSGEVKDKFEAVYIGDLDEGNYSIEIRDTFGNVELLHWFVGQPSRLATAHVTSDYEGYAISCNGYTNGYIVLNQNGGTIPYTHIFEGVNPISDTITNLSQGEYEVMTIDANGCKVLDTVLVDEPDELSVDIVFIDPDCTDRSSGKILMQRVQGGVGGYVFGLDSLQLAQASNFEGLVEGVYTYVVGDANGCLLSQTDTLFAVEIPEIYINQTAYSVVLGDSILLNTQTNLANQIVEWKPQENVANPNELNTSILPLQDGIFTLVVTSQDGCQDSVSIHVRVEKRRSFVIANVLSLDGNGINDQLTYFTGNDVASVNYYRMYDRWGGLLYDGELLAHEGINILPWDGTYNGQLLQPGVYVWMASVTYIDGETEMYKGDMTIVR